MKTVFVISTAEIIGGKTAGAGRILNIARSVAAGDVTVYLCSYSDFRKNGPAVGLLFNKVYSYGVTTPGMNNRHGLLSYLRETGSLMAAPDSEKVVYLYPTTLVFRDFIFLLYFKFFKRHHFFCEINELRSAIAFSSAPPDNIFKKVVWFLKSVKDWLVYKLNELQVPFYDGITVISTELESHFSRPARKITRIPILCNADLIVSQSEPLRFAEGVFKICFAGYIKFEKEGFDLLLESLAAVNKSYPVELHLYGKLEEEDQAKLDHYTIKYDLGDRICYHGNFDPERLQAEFQKYHLLILPRTLNNRTKYGFSTKLTEYLVSGKPVLLTDVSDNSLFLRDGYNCFMIAPGNAGIMSSKIIEVIDTYNEVADKIVENAFVTVREQLDYRHFTQNYYSLFFGDERSQRQKKG